MLHILPLNKSNYFRTNDIFQYKCGEIFCNDIIEFVIHCNVCNVEPFQEFADFIQHIKNVHCQDERFKSNSTNFDDINCNKLEVVEIPAPGEHNHQEVTSDQIRDIARHSATIKEEGSSDEEQQSTNPVNIENFSWAQMPYLVTNGPVSNNNQLEIIDNEPLISLKYHTECHRVTRSAKKLTQNRNIPKEQKECNSVISTNEEITSNENICQKLLSQATNIEIYLPSEGISKSDLTYKCTYCDRQYKFNSQLKNHILRQHASATDNKITNPTILENDENDISQGSRKKSNSDYVFKEKTDGSESMKWCCNECLATFDNKRLHDRHCIENHCGFKCSLCDKRFSQRYQCKRHEQTHVAVKTLLCPVEGCGKFFADRYYLKRHQDVHKTDRIFFCDFDNCNKSFHTRRRLLAHKKIHTKPKNLICDICGYCCRERETLRVHQRIHTGERPYGCAVCEKRFASSSSLAEHMASHSSGRPHVCKVCRATFARQKALYHHSFLHLEFKKFKCKICGRAYRQAAGLSGHMRKHREENALLQSLAADVAQNAQNTRFKLLKVSDSALNS